MNSLAATIWLTLASVFYFALWLYTIRRKNFENPDTWVDFWMYLIVAVVLGVAAALNATRII